MNAALPRDLRPDVAEAERHLLAACLYSADALDDAAAVVAEDDFHAAAHRAVWRAAVGLRANGEPADAAAVFQELSRRGWLPELDATNPQLWLAELVQAERSGAAAPYYTARVLEASKLRKLRHVAGVILRDATDPTSSADELLAQAEQAVFDVAGGAAGAEAVPDAAALMTEVLQGIDDRAAGGSGGLETGFRELDTFTQGLHPGQLIILGARPSVGKTALALGVAANVAESGTPVYFASLEMRRAEIGERLLARSSGVPMPRIRAGKIDGTDADAFYRAAERLRGIGLHVDDRPDVTVTRLASVARRMIRRRNVALVVVDYLTLIRPENTKDNRTLQVGTMARRLKLLARQCNVPVLCLAQLNREVEGRGDGRPRLSDLRDSGEVEQHADQVWLLHRRAGMDEAWIRWDIDVIVAKNRNGPTGDVRLTYNRPVLRFETPAA